MTMLSTVLAALALATAVPQQTPPAPPPLAPQEATQLEDIVVTSERARETASKFVDRVGAPAGSRRLARWPGRVCVSVANLSHAPAQYMIDRISQLAHELGLEIGEPGCTANVVIVATTDASAMATALVEQNRNAFVPGGGGMSRSLALLDDFKTTDRPVRWWHVSVPVDSETGQRAVRLPGEEPPAINVSRASRLRSDIRDDLNKAFIVIDVDRLGETTFTQLVDYVAMVAMAQVDIKAPTADIPTVLNVFDDPASTPGFTSWDLAYLHALYRAEPDRATVGGQAADITGLMLQARRDDEAE